MLKKTNTKKSPSTRSKSTNNKKTSPKMPRTPKMFSVDKMIESKEINKGTSLSWASQASGIKDDAKVAAYIKKNGGRVKDGIILDPGTSQAIYIKGHGYKTPAQAKHILKQLGKW